MRFPQPRTGPLPLAGLRQGIDEADLADLLLRCSTGCRRSFEEIHRRTAPRVFALLMMLLRDREEARDAMQEVYVRLWTRAGSFDASGANPQAWVTVLARNVAIDRLRVRQRAVPQDSYTDDHARHDGPAHEDRLALGHCLSRLEPDRRALVRQVYVEGASYEDMARATGTPLNTIRSWLRRSLMQLRQCLTEGRME